MADSPDNPVDENLPPMTKAQALQMAAAHGQAIAGNAEQMLNYLAAARQPEPDDSDDAAQDLAPLPASRAFPSSAQGRHVYGGASDPHGTAAKMRPPS